MKKYKDFIKNFLVYACLFAASIIIIITLLNMYQSIIFENKESSLSDLMKLDYKKILPTLIISSVIIFALSLFPASFISSISEVDKRDENLKKLYIYAFLLNLLIASLAILNTDQFSVLVGAISLAALVWPRIKS